MWRGMAAVGDCAPHLPVPRLHTAWNGRGQGQAFRCLAGGNGRLAPKPPLFFSEGAKSGPKSLKQFCFNKCHEAHHIDQRNVLNTKMYVWWGPKTASFSRVKSGEKWPILAG